MQHPDALDEDERGDLTALRQAHSALEIAYGFTQDFLQMMHKREGERLDVWLAQVQENQLPELQSFASGVEQDQAAVQAGLTLVYSNGQVEGQVNKLKLLKRIVS
jgi:transposase